jgi:hypothetical protein
MSDYYDPSANWSLIPPHMRPGVERYVMLGIPPGDFLRAVLRNDMMEALGRADEDNLAAMRGYAQFLYGYTPHGCYGSPEAYKRWVEQGGLRGIAGAVVATLGADEANPQ